MAPCLDIVPLKLNFNNFGTDFDAVKNRLLYACMKVCRHGSMQVCDKKLTLGFHFLTKQSFRHFVNKSSNPNTSLTKII